ncbi:MAG: PAS domain-containing protein [Steroidobacteraceae bacterium]
MTDDLQKAQARLQSILNNVPAMIGYWNRELYCEFANSAYLDWFGLSPERVVGMHMPELLGAKLFELNEPYVRQALSGEPQHFERALIKADGSTGYADAFYIPDFDRSGMVRGFFLMGSDITALRASLTQTRELTQRLEGIREEERKNIAHALHEGIAQDLFAAKLTLDHLKARACSGESNTHENLWRELSEAIAACMRSTREIANEVRPSSLAHLDLSAAITEHAHRIECVSGLKITVKTEIPLPALDPVIRSIIFRAAQEALTNVIRHAKAATVGITLGVRGSSITLEVIDDGYGIEAGDTEKAGSLGLLGIRERFAALGGEVSVTRMTRGTRFCAHVPMGSA